jgi:hypothetical protein
MPANIIIINIKHIYFKAKVKPQYLVFIVYFLKQKTPKEQLLLMTLV